MAVRDDVAVLSEGSVSGLLSSRYGAWYAARQPQTLREARLRYLRELRAARLLRGSGAARRAGVRCRWCLLVECMGRWLVEGVYVSELVAGRAREEFVVKQRRVLLVDLAALYLLHGESGGTMDEQAIRTRVMMGGARMRARVDGTRAAGRKPGKGRLVARMKQLPMEGV